jgi:hypothetical protein
VVSDGHQCQPSLFIALPISGAGLAERMRRHRRLRAADTRIAGRPETPIMRSFSSKNGSSAVVDRPVVGDAVERLHLEIGGMQRGQCAVYITVPPPTPLKFTTLIGELSSLIG